MTTNDQQAVLVYLESLLAQLNQADTMCRDLEAKKDKAIEEVTKKFAPRVDEVTTVRNGLMEKVTELFIENESWLTEQSKTAVFRSATLSSHTSPGKLVIDDEEQAMTYLRRVRKLLAFTRQGKRTLDKVKLKKHPELIKKMPGVRVEVGEFLTVRLARTQIELTEDLQPYRRRVK